MESRRVGVCGRLWRGVDFPCAVMVANKQTGPLLDAVYVNTYLHGRSNCLLAALEVHQASIQNFSRDFGKCVGDLVFSAFETSDGRSFNAAVTAYLASTHLTLPPE